MSLDGLVEHLDRVITPAHVDQFTTEGYAVVDGGFPESLADAYLAQITKAKQEGMMDPNKVQFLTGSGPIEVTKPHVYEADMHQRPVRSKLPAFDALFNGGVDAIAGVMNKKVPGLDLIHREPEGQRGNAFTIKAQVNEGGCFPWHYDNPAKPNRRRLTFALYLCKEWTGDVGGELVVMPFLKQQVAIPPRFNRLVLFRADMAIHRVLPCKLGFTRTCFTIWMDSESTNTDGEVNLRAKHLSLESKSMLMTTPLQRSLSRAVYDEEYTRSAVECFGGGSREAKISAMIHEAHLKPLKANAALWAFVEQLRAERPVGDCDDAEARRRAV
jgi:hypothetical protein